MAYVTKQEIAFYLGVTINSSIQTYIDTVIASAEAYVEKFCGNGLVKRRWFDDDDSSVTRYYNGNGSHKLMIDDVRSITSLVVDGVTLVENTDFYLYPLNASEDGMPYEWIELIQPENATPSHPRANATYQFDEGQRNIAITGKFGYSTTPPADIKLAILKLCGGILKENIGDTDLKELTSENLGAYNATFVKVKDVAHAIGVDDILKNANLVRQPITGKKSVAGISLI